ncbi:MAG: FAD-dependent oxidoreductase [Tepidisphaeraceae bacterium]|jgi:NADPH-dependent 2,4-dienoyl-CoA reductase/sulfur reductase-like enzyme
MSNLHVKYLLVGAGMASSQAAEEIRKIDPRGDLLLVGQEIKRPYRRRPLSRQYLLGERDHEQLFTLSSDWCVQNHVQLRTGQRATHLDAHRHGVTLDNGEEISFDRLLIATGASPRQLRVLGADLPNLFYLRTLEDAERLSHAIDKAKREGRKHANGRGKAVVIGGGLLGVELAGTLTMAGVHVDLVTAGNEPWENIASESTGKWVAKSLEKQGVGVHVGNRATRLDGDGRVQRVVLASGGSIDTDFAVATIGLDVHREFLRSTPIAAEKAVLVDQRCQTNIPSIFAAGDCAALYDPLFGKHRLLSHWESATETGAIAGVNMAGGSAFYDSVSHFHTLVMDLRVDVWGEAKVVDRRIRRESNGNGGETPNFIELGVAADGRIAQVIAVGPGNERFELVELVRRRVQVAGKEEKLKDPSVPIGSILGLS